MKRFITSVQKATGLTATEAIVVCALALVIGIGWVGKTLSPKPQTHDIATIERIAAILDSLENSTTRELENSKSPSGITRELEKSKNRNQIAVGHGARLVNINTASRSQLMHLPGIGPSTADKILEHRKTRPFTTIDDLLDVKGIGPAKLQKMRAFIAVP